MIESLRFLCMFAVACALAASSGTHPAQPGKPDAVTPDGGRYYGSLIGGSLEGHGALEWDHGTRYVGEFARGYFWGQGELSYADGRSYRGGFVRGQFHGHGRYEQIDGDVYEGEFEHNAFTGQGVRTTRDGTRHEGRFLKWRPNGPGRVTDASGHIHEGEFRAGELEGNGRFTTPSGVSYEGAFRHGRFHGQGVLRLANGDVYRGGFSHGAYDGEGTLTYANPLPDGRTHVHGTWQYGRLADDPLEGAARQQVEAALYSQRALLDKALASIAPSDPSRINLYFLAVAGDGSQEVFRREVEYVRRQFDRDFGTSGRSLALINSRSTTATVPMATVTSIRESLEAIARRMDKDKDVLFLFLTSHGSKDHVFTLNQNKMELPGLSARELGALLKATGIRWKVLVVSACYSGGFIDQTKDPHTLVITAARHDRTSFGCADENDFTYFGRAFFQDALPESASFQAAFHKAASLIRERELEALKPEERVGNPGLSLPQMHEAPALTQYLERWWTEVAPGHSRQSRAH